MFSTKFIVLFAEVVSALLTLGLLAWFSAKPVLKKYVDIRFICTIFVSIIVVVISATFAMALAESLYGLINR
jgi:hypothetical protein